jgi:hypothetical protein
MILHDGCPGLGAPVREAFRSELTTRDLSEGKMLILFSTLILASQLIVTVADTVPNFDIERGCKDDSAAAFDPNAGLNATIKRCADDEQQAKDQLQTQWSQFAPSDKNMCMGLVTGDAASITPSYVELLTCLQGQQLVRKLPKDWQVSTSSLLHQRTARLCAFEYDVVSREPQR